VEFKRFLIKIDKEVPADLDIHLICDNYGTHKHPAIVKRLKLRPFTWTKTADEILERLASDLQRIPGAGH
jgi:hypothetical protein